MSAPPIRQARSTPGPLPTCGRPSFARARECSKPSSSKTHRAPVEQRSGRRGRPSPSGPAGVARRVLAVYQDGTGVLEEAFSAATAPVANISAAPVGTLTVSDTTPTEGSPLTAVSSITDADGTVNAVFAFQWQVSTTPNGNVFNNIAGATDETFTPTQAQVGLRVRVVMTYTDDQGTPETVTSAPTSIVGDLFIGTAGIDTFTGTPGEDNIQGRAGNDLLSGAGGADMIQGEGGNDTLNGGAGADTLVGGQGTDTLNGDAGADTLDGGADADTLNGGDGNDTLNGGAANDSLNGGAGNDTLRGEGGADTMAGNAGNDIYVVEQTNDVVNEALNAGTDTVQTSLATHTLAANVENLTFTGTGDFTGTGNAVANLITGGAGNDTLSGLAGADDLRGGAGNDSFIGGAGADRMVGGLGDDTYTVEQANDTVVERIVECTGR